MAIKKSELYGSLWKSCDELRGGMDASQYKDYVLTLLFVKYVSDKYAGQPDAPIVVPPGGSFADMVRLKGDKEIGDQINKIIGRLAEANELRGVINIADFNDPDKLGQGKEMQEKLSNLVAIFENPALDFSRNRADGDDLLGDAYEYLMRHFATESGKSKGQFYTPAEVSRVIAKVIGIGAASRSSQTIYDPACGSGSLLLKAADEAPVRISIYGQEMDNATAALARMNMFLHDHPTHEIKRGNSLANPRFLYGGGLQRFDYAVANPPFSSKAWSSGFDPAEDPFDRFPEQGTLVPPAKNGDYAFLLHLLASLHSTGKGAIILPHGVLFRGNAEARIRTYLVQRGVVKGIIGLPPNLFYGTGIPACILVLDKEHAAARGGIFLIDASKGFVKDGNKNRLRHQDVHKIVDVFNRERDVPGYARMVPLAEIEANGYNLNIPRYIDSSEPEDLHDIAAHLLGGIPERDVDALEPYWREFPALKQRLFAPAARPGTCALRVEPEQVKETIACSAEFLDFARRLDARLEGWRAQVTPLLRGLAVGSHPKQLIETLSEGLLHTFAGAPLVDPYDIYQHMMSYWTETMQDDVYLISADGWVEAARLRPLEQSGAKNKEEADLKVGKQRYKADLIPPELLVARFFAADREAIGQLEAARDGLEREQEELEEEHGGEGGLLEEARNDKGRITAASLKARMRDLLDERDSDEELSLLNRLLGLLDERAAAERRIKEAEDKLAGRLLRKYQQLRPDEITVLVVDDKWLATLAAAVRGESGRVLQALAARVRLLAERYAAPLPQLSAQADDLATRVAQHLERMGFAWT